MKTKTFSFNFKNKEFSLVVRRCSIFSSGLMFRKRSTLPCLFEFKKKSNFKITSWWVFFPFVAVWLDSKNKVLDLKRVEPFTSVISSDKSHYKLLEIPVNEDNKELIEFLVGS